MNHILDIQYSLNPPLCFDLHVPHAVAPAAPMIIFVHGGAWRAEDKSHWHSLGQRLASAAACPVLVPNYRLTPSNPTPDNQFQHPGHAEDILQFLNFVTSGTWSGIDSESTKFDPTGRGLYLLGHSAGAHILSSIFLDSSNVTPSLTPPAALLRLTKGFALSEGIYDIDQLLNRFPSYRGWFIAAAFGDRVSYEDVSTTRMVLRQRDAAVGEGLRWLIIHSKGDTLVDQAQSDGMYEHLGALYGEEKDKYV
ncbi:esterase lipase [Favolaschia claudopus]|uniref:Esterase lipase n=1 Tax=Favolaschia claudopus TaxID=2862362 RepID=A0AAW0APG6_9AGAR